MMEKRRSNFLSEDELKIVEDEMAYTLSFDEALDLFLKEGTLKNLRPDTLTYYRNELTTFKKLLLEQNLPTDPWKIDEKTIKEGLILYMKENGAKTTSINARLRAVRAFFNFLEKKGKIRNNPMKDIQLLSDKRNPIQTFTQEQIKAMLNAIDLKTFTGVRDYTIVLLLLETGIRLKELVALNVQDVELEAGQMLVRNPKNQLERYVPLGRRMRDQLKKYLKIRGYLETDALFVTVDNKRISRKQVENRLKIIGKQAGITGVRCSPHTFRHTFAKMSILNGAGVFELQAILGHSSMEMVRIYVNLFSPEVKELHKKFSPVEKLLK